MGAAATSTVATGVASGVMPPQILGGPLFWLMTVLLFGAGMLAVFVVIDVARRAISYGDHAAEKLRLGYLIPQLIFVVLMMLSQFEGLLPIEVVGIVTLCAPVALIQGLAYLLIVVFPKPAVVPTEEELELFTGDEESPEPESHPQPHEPSAADE